MSCFCEKENDVCEKCGYIAPQKRSSSFLPAGHLLQNRYIIGEILTSDKMAVEYKAFDTTKGLITEIQEYFPRDFAHRESNSPCINVSSQENLDVYNKNIDSIRSTAEKMINFSSSQSVVNVYGCFAENNTVYVVKEYIEGMRLSDYLSSAGDVIDAGTALEIIIPVLDGLSELHSAGLVHRSLTPNSIAITVDNKIKITDFRFLKDASPYKDEDMTVHFTPGYAPPEQYLSKSRQGAFSDIYSVGAILYKMLTGEKPDDAPNRMSEETVVSPDQINPDIAQHVSLSIMKALEVTSELRFKTAADFKNSLLGIKEVVDVGGVINQEKNKKIRRTVIGIGVAVIIALLVIYLKVI